MPSKFLIVNAVLYLFCLSMMSQNNDTQKNTQNALKPTDSIEVINPINPLSPAKAAFYSAVLPGLGQAYNKKYWKIPLVYGTLGTGVYFYVTNKKNYDRYRDAYKRRLAGFNDDEFNGRITLDGLQRGQKFYKKNKEVALLVTIGIYALNIIDANVDAHLLQFNVDENLTLSPHFKFNEIDRKSNLGLTLNFKF